MTEYANTPSVIEEWNHQRDRTHTWVTSALPPEHCAPPSRTPSSGSEYARRSLWDGSGWEPQSDCESATSIPPTMMLQYSNDRTEIVTPSQSETSGWMGRGKGRARAREEERTERAPSHHQRSSAHSHQLHNSVKPVQTAQTHHHPTVHSHSSSVRLAHAAAAPLPESRSSSGGSGSARSRELRSNESLQRNPRTSSKHSRTSFDRQPSTSPGPAVHTSPSPISPVGPASNVAASHHSQSQSHAQAYVHSRSQSQTAPQPLPPSSFRSNSLSTSRTLSSDPEPIIVHPPAPSASASQSQSTQSHSSSSAYPQSYVPSHYSQRTVQAAVHVPLPPPSTASASLSYYSQTPSQVQIQVQPPSHHSATPTPSAYHAQMQSHHSAHAPPSTAPRSYSATTPYQTPLYALAPLVHSQSHPPAAQPQSARASTMSHGSQAGLGGGYVVVNPVDAEGQGGEWENSAGSRRRRDRGSLFNVFGGSRPSRSRSGPQAPPDLAAQAPPPVLGSSASHRSHRSHRSHHSHSSNPYMSPVSLGSPMRNSPPIPSHNVNIHHDPAFGPNPPSIVYAPARHGQTTHYSPPRIMYMPGASLRGQAQAQAPPRERSPTGSVRRAVTIASPSAAMHEGLPREGLDVRNAWPGEGWGAERREGSLMRQASVAQDQFTHTYPSPVHGDTHVPAAVGSTGTSTADADGNMAGVGTLQNRSRSRSRSRARGMAFSASEPHPVAPTAVMMAAPPEAPGLGSIPMTTRHAGLTPYPTPPGSSGSHHTSIAAPRPDSVAEPIHSAQIPDNGNVGGNVSGGGGGLMSRFRDLRLSGAVPAPAPGSPRRGRGREREKKSKEPAKALEARRERKEPRALSADSEVSHSSASTYYVIQTPGQKVRIIRTDGQTVTATTTASRFSAPHAGGWLKKALTPRFLHTSAAAVQPAPAMGRMDSSGSKKREGRKLVRRNSTGTTALLSRQPSVNAP